MAMSDCAAWDAHNETIITCRKCPRLTAWREEMARVKRRAYRDEDYWGKPVPGFGDPQARLLVVGLAPGAHGSNRTGRMFTGDSSGQFLYAALHRAGFANQSSWEHRDDGLTLHDVFITAVARCAPPDNKPTTAEITTCFPYVREEMTLLAPVRGVVALGQIAFDWMWRELAPNGMSRPRFAHNLLTQPAPDGPWLLAAYHPSRQNTQTGRLTAAMFDAVWQRARDRLDGVGLA